MSVATDGMSGTDVRVQEWLARNPLRRWRVHWHRPAPEVELQLRLPRGQIREWETGAAVPDAHVLRALARMTGIADLASRWTRWTSLRPSARDETAADDRSVPGAAPATECVSDGRSDANGHPRTPEALDRLLAEMVGWSGIDSPLRALYPWEALPAVVDDEIARARSLGYRLALVLWEITRPPAMPEQAWTACLRYLAGRIGGSLPPGSLFFRDDTGRFVVLLARASEAEAREYVESARPVLADDLPVIDVAGGGRLTVQATVASYPGHGETADALLGRLDASLAAMIGTVDSYGTRSA